MKQKPLIILAAGGTGGHINAALALGEECLSQNMRVKYLTGTRPLDYKLFKQQPVEHLASRPLRDKNPVKLLVSIILNFKTFVSLMMAFIKDRPMFAVGCGGYVCGPTLLAAKCLGIPVYIFEQNAVLGLTNKILSIMANKIFLHFKQTRGLSPRLISKTVVVGNPTRSTIRCADRSHHPRRFLVFGGSLGASQINQMIYDFIQLDQDLPTEIIHQTGSDEKFVVKLGRNVTYQSFKYLDSIQDQYNWCSHIVSRAGASTVAELKIVQKPCFLIPFPQATDNHQYFNAKALSQESNFPVQFVDPRAPDQEIYQSLKNYLEHPPIMENPLLNKEGLSVAKNAIQYILKDVGFSKK